MGLTSYLWSAAPFVAMITVECTDVGISVISKAALTKGMSNIVSVVYYNALGTLILLPYLIFCRNKQLPLTFSLLWRFFLLGLIGSSGQIVYLTGVKYSSPTLSSALVNLIPIFTFLLAVIFRMEKLELGRSSSQAKALGAVVAVTGAFVVTLYKGPSVLMASSPSNFPQNLHLSDQSKWIIGGFLIVLVCLSSATWNVVQAATVKEYPDKMTTVFFYTFFITIQSLVFSLILERSPTAWKLKSNVEVAAIVCTAIFGSLFRIAIHTWCLQKKGPVYVSMFKPLGIVVAVVLTVIFLGDTLYLGSVIGSVIIAIGFYTVMWGQAKEKNMVLENEVSRLESSGQKDPLIPSS
ncbi:WAT1-related protein At3g28050-like [Herrania umbratica]|uniref:WAT1-related protein n=1 Tax=Herrania umbratica TaxID=108875 RepID=A0A6J1BJ13_9ROSI|nr:WAT1-related protein At3g28050-like [Herrania umbratica]